MNKEHTLIRLVDDDESLLFSTKILLEALGWKVAAYNSPTEFLVRDNLSIPGCAVLDVRMPQMTGLEVLMRWKHPTMGEIPPDAFINFAEAQKLIVPLTLHLFDLIIHDAPVLQTLLPPGAKVGINIAPGHLHAESFKDDMRTLDRKSVV